MLAGRIQLKVVQALYWTASSCLQKDSANLNRALHGSEVSASVPLHSTTGLDPIGLAGF